MCEAVSGLLGSKPKDGQGNFAGFQGQPVQEWCGSCGDHRCRQQTPKAKSKAMEVTSNTPEDKSDAMEVTGQTPEAKSVAVKLLMTPDGKPCLPEPAAKRDKRPSFTESVSPSDTLPGASRWHEGEESRG